MKYTLLKIIGITTVGFMLSSCSKKLNLLPTNDVTAETVYSTAAGYKLSLAKVYGSMALTGNNGPAGNGDIQGIDEGFSDFLRLLWKSEELPTDEAVIAWGDIGIQDFHNMNWSSSNPFLQGLYYRSMYTITLCNDFIRQSTDAKLSSRGISGADADNIRKYAAEARYLRAFQYWVMMDIFANPPFATEATIIGGPPPPQISRTNLFNYVESELKAIEPLMADAKANEYGRADKAAVWSLLARIYLNAKVYTGTDHNADAITYSKKVIDAGYSLITNYPWLMLADNQQNTSEFIFTINYDGLKTQGYGGTTFLNHASTGGFSGYMGNGGGWYGLRCTKNLPNLFPDYTGTIDKRAQFYTSGQSLDISDETQFGQGFAVTKYRNVTRTGANGSSLDFADIDFPLFRLSEMYFIYAEATLRGGAGGSNALALQYMNAIRTRAYGNVSGNITAGQLTLDFILDERARELYWEGFRRTDLIRYDRFVEGTYLWPWKGGVSGGQAVDPKYKIYPLPSSDISVNPNLHQNTGY